MLDLRGSTSPTFLFILIDLSITTFIDILISIEIISWAV